MKNTVVICDGKCRAGILEHIKNDFTHLSILRSPIIDGKLFLYVDGELPEDLVGYMKAVNLLIGDTPIHINVLTV